MKKIYFLFIISGISVIFSVFLCIFCVPNEIPVFFDFHENIAALFTKWALALFWLLTIFSCIINFKINKNMSDKFWVAINFALIFVNVIFTSVLALSKSVEFGKALEVPLSVVFGLPLAIIFVSVPYKIKTAKYGSKFAFRTKYSLESEFLWTQTQLIAYERLKPVCLCLFLIALIFAPFRLFYIELAIFFFAILITNVLIIRESKRIYLKYKDMETRKNNLSNTKQ